MVHVLPSSSDHVITPCIKSQSPFFSEALKEPSHLPDGSFTIQGNELLLRFLSAGGVGMVPWLTIFMFFEFKELLGFFKFAIR